jgi:arylsulfatase A-like enzyme
MDDSAYTVFPDEKRPNIILVIWDAATARDMQVYGYERPNTPFLSEWAKDAIVFTRAYASSNWTTPTIMSLMTSQRVWTHRVWYSSLFTSVSKYENNLPRVLQEHGYEVYGFIQNHGAHPEHLGIGEAFLVKDKADTFFIASEWWFDRLMRKMKIKRPVVNDWIFYTNFIAEGIRQFKPDSYITNAPADKVYNRFLDYISQKNLGNTPQRPFFAWLHLYPPHNFYLPPKPYIGMFGDAEKFNSEKKQHRLFRGGYYKFEEQADVDILKKRYDEFILYCDQQFKTFLSRLAKVINMSNTIIILSSDHGESFSRGYLGHGGVHLFEEVVHIPLIIKMPGDKKGKVVDMPVEQIDIAPTILDIAGIPIPQWMEGQSLLPLLEGKALKSRPVFSMQFINNSMLDQPLIKGTIAVWDGDYKLIHYLEEKKSLLFNLRADPYEMRNIFNEEPEIAQRLMKLIEDNLAKANARIIQASE